MKKILAVTLLCLSTSIFAIKSKKIVASALAPIPTSYSITNGQSWVLSELPGIYKHIKILNNTSSTIACHVDNSSKTAAPSNDDGHDTYHLSVGGAIYDSTGVSANVFCRSDSGTAITNGSLYVEAW